MKKSLIWITAGIAAVGFGVPAFAAHGDSPSDITPAPTQVSGARATPVTVSDDSVPDDSVPDNSVPDISGPFDEAEHANDPRCTGVDDSGHDGSDDSGHGHGSDDD